MFISLELLPCFLERTKFLSSYGAIFLALVYFMAMPLKFVFSRSTSWPDGNKPGSRWMLSKKQSIDTGLIITYYNQSITIDSHTVRLPESCNIPSCKLTRKITSFLGKWSRDGRHPASHIAHSTAIVCADVSHVSTHCVRSEWQLQMGYWWLLSDLFVILHNHM